MMDAYRRHHQGKPVDRTIIKAAKQTHLKQLTSIRRAISSSRVSQ